MALALNPFDELGYTVAEMTRGINLMPNVWGLIGQLGLFRPVPVSSTTAIVEVRNNVLNLLPSVPRGGPRTVANRDTRSLRSFLIPHIPHEDAIQPQDIQDVRAFATPADAERLTNVMARKMAKLRLKHAQTLEWMMMSALRGVLMDGAQNEVFDWNAEFGITYNTPIDFKFSDATHQPDDDIRTLKRYMETHLFGETMTGIMVLCSSEWMDALISHPKLREAYLYFSAQPNPNRDDVRSRFVHQGVTFVEYLASWTDASGNLAKAIADGEAWAFPLGTQETFEVYYAPGNFIDTVNEPGQEVYARQFMPQDMSQVSIISESNPLPMVRRPGLCVKLTMS